MLLTDQQVKKVFQPRPRIVVVPGKYITCGRFVYRGRPFDNFLNEHALAVMFPKKEITVMEEENFHKVIPQFMDDEFCISQTPHIFVAEKNIYFRFWASDDGKIVVLIDDIYTNYLPTRLYYSQPSGMLCSVQYPKECEETFVAVMPGHDGLLTECYPMDSHEAITQFITNKRA